MMGKKKKNKKNSKNMRPGTNRPRQAQALTPRESDSTNPSTKKSNAKPIMVTVRGIELTLDEDRFNDFEFIDALDQVDAGLNPLRAAYVMRTITGDKFGDVMDVLRDPETKRVPPTSAAQFVKEFMQEAAKKAPKQ